MQRVSLSANADWRFYRGAPPSGREDAVSRSSAKPPFDRDYDDGAWEIVNLPHTVREEKLMTSGGLNYQGESWYRKRFTLPDHLADLDLLLEFEGAMQRIDVWLDGVPLGWREGGFLPQAFDLTNRLDAGAEHVLAVRADNSDMPDVPPGKPQGALDFNYFGGLYRDAWLHAAGKVRFSFAAHEGKPASGGIYVSYPVVSASRAIVRVKGHALNHTTEIARAALRVALTDMDGHEAARAISDPFTIPPSGDAESSVDIEIANPTLWSPYNPYLYQCSAQLLDSSGAVLDELRERVGVREIRFTSDGFFINGEKLFLSGANRHQDYAYIGFAQTDGLQRRDAAALREAGMLAIRTGHYPQDKAFMDACDELGMLCVIPTPGWQIHPQSVKFDEASYENTRRLIRYNRNHPSAALWEPILNETDYPAYFALKQLAIVREETEEGAPVWCACDGHYACSESYPVNYGFFFGPKREGKPLFVREYGDAFTEQFGPTGTVRRVRRGADTGFYRGGERFMIRSAEERFEDYAALRSAPGLCGATMWAGIDHNRGYDPNEAPVGMFDLLRLPKFTREIYAAQQSVDQAGPLCFIANYWTEDSPRDVVVYTNCEAVRLILNGRVVGTLAAREGWAATRVYSGAACGWRFKGGVSNDSIPEGTHPPLTFKDVPFEPGELTAEALIDGKAAARYAVRTPGRPVRLQLVPHWQGTERWIADGSDLLMVHVFSTDENGTMVPSDEREVRFTADGGAAVVGSDPRASGNPVRLEAGASGVLLRAGVKPGITTLRADADGLESASITLRLERNDLPQLPGPAQTPPERPPVYPVDKRENFSAINPIRTESWYKLNLAKGGRVCASSSAVGFPPENAVRGLAAEPWIAADNAMPQWLACDFGEDCWFFGATVFWQHDGLWYDYSLQISNDGSAWRTVSSGHASGQNYVPVHLEEPVKARHARVLCRGVSGGQVPAGITMVEFHGRPPSEGR